MRRNLTFLLGTVTGACLTVLVSGPQGAHLVAAAKAAARPDTYSQLNLFGDVFERIKADYVEKPDDAKLVEGAINGMISSLDPHSRYMSAKGWADMQETTRGEFGGLGMEVTMEDGLVKVVAPIDDTPAAKAGIMSGDLISQIDDEAIQGLTLEQAVSKMKGAPDILVNNAGLFRVAVADETSGETFIEVINTNLVAPFLFVRAFLSDMKKRKSGHIITLGSIADRTIYTGNAAYSAAKFGLRAVHEVLRAELRGSGVKTSLISPAATNTEMWNGITITDPAGKPHSTRPMLEPDDVVRAVMFALTQPERVNVDELRLSHS